MAAMSSCLFSPFSPRPTQPFTPYSVTIGGVVRELHRGLLLALTAEVNATTLTQLIKCLGLLVANCPYHQLSAGYIARVTATLGRLSTHRGEGGRVGGYYQVQGKTTEGGLMLQEAVHPQCRWCKPLFSSYRPFPCRCECPSGVSYLLWCCYFHLPKP